MHSLHLRTVPTFSSSDIIHRSNDFGFQATCCTLDLGQVCRLVNGLAERGTFHSQDKAVQRQDLQVDSVPVTTFGLSPHSSISGYSSTACVVEKSSSFHLSGRTWVEPEIELLLLHLGDIRPSSPVVLSVFGVRPTPVLCLGGARTSPTNISCTSGYPAGTRKTGFRHLFTFATGSTSISQGV